MHSSLEKERKSRAANRAKLVDLSSAHTITPLTNATVLARPLWPTQQRVQSAPQRLTPSDILTLHRVPPPPTSWQGAQARYLHLPGSAPEISGHRDSNSMGNELDVEEVGSPTPEESNVGPAPTLQEGGIYTLQSSLEVTGTMSGMKQTIQAGTQVYISDIRGNKARADGNDKSGTNGYAPIAAIESAIGAE